MRKPGRAIVGSTGRPRSRLDDQRVFRFAAGKQGEDEHDDQINAEQDCAKYVQGREQIECKDRRQLLAGTALAREPDRLVLRLARGSGVFTGDSVTRRLDRLATALGLEACAEEV